MNPELQSLVSDIAVAMFKVASIIRHTTLKAELENKAISLVSNPNSDTIINIANLVILGREIGEIRPSNVVILIRELEALRKGILISPAVEEMDISSHFNHNNLDDNEVVSLPLPADDISVSFSPTKTEDLNPAPGLDKIINSPTVPKTFFNPDKVYQYIVARKGTKLKELESAFNAVSGRTLRRITDSLIKEGKIERVGNPGPTSFYRVPVSPTDNKKQVIEDSPRLETKTTDPVSQSSVKQDNPQSAEDKNQVPAPVTPATAISAPAPVISLPASSVPSAPASSPVEAFKHLSF